MFIRLGGLGERVPSDTTLRIFYIIIFTNSIIVNFIIITF